MAFKHLHPTWLTPLYEQKNSHLSALVKTAPCAGTSQQPKGPYAFALSSGAATRRISLPNYAHDPFSVCDVDADDAAWAPRRVYDQLWWDLKGSQNCHSAPARTLAKGNLPWILPNSDFSPHRGTMRKCLHTDSPSLSAKRKAFRHTMLHTFNP